MKDNNSLAHRSWKCKYHLVFAPKYMVASITRYLKGKSSLMIFDRHVNYKYKYGNRHFWCRGYYVDTVGKNKKAIEEYIRKQLKEDIATNQISIKEYIEPFEKEKKEKERNAVGKPSVGFKPRSASTKAFYAKSKPPVLLVVMINNIYIINL